LSLSHVRTPFLPVFCALSILLQALLFLGEILVVIDFDHGGELALPIFAGLFLLMLGKHHSRRHSRNCLVLNPN